MKIFFDMDGTLAKFYHDKQYLEHMYEPEYFLDLKPYKLVNYVNKLIDMGTDVYILSACIESKYCEHEKLRWVEKYLPHLPLDHIIFTKTGENKAEIVDNLIESWAGEAMVLVDDYSKNLYDWEMCGKEFVAVKYCNGLNNKTNKNYTYKVKTIRQLHKLLDKIYEDFKDGEVELS